MSSKSNVSRFLRPTDSSLRHQTPALWANLRSAKARKGEKQSDSLHTLSEKLSSTGRGIMDILKIKGPPGMEFDMPKQTSTYARVVLEESEKLAKLFEYGCHMSPMSRQLDNLKFVKCLKLFGVIRKGGLRTVDADLAFMQAKARGYNTVNFSGFGRALHVLALKAYGSEVGPEKALSTLLERDVQVDIDDVNDGGGDDDSDQYEDYDDVYGYSGETFGNERSRPNQSFPKRNTSVISRANRLF